MQSQARVLAGDPFECCGFLGGLGAWGFVEEHLKKSEGVGYRRRENESGS